MLPPSGLLQVAKVFAVTFGEDTSLQGWIADRLEYVWLSDFVGGLCNVHSKRSRITQRGLSMHPSAFSAFEPRQSVWMFCARDLVFFTSVTPGLWLVCRTRLLFVGLLKSCAVA